MAVADYTALQQAILRKTLQQEAEVQNAAGTDLAVYEEQLIERAETSTQAALLISQIVLGKVPVDGAKLTSLTLFAQQQFDYYANVLQVANPALGPYEALGRGFASTPEFAALVAAAGGSNGQFVTNTYVAAFGTTPSGAQVQHFVDQIDYFTNLYKAAGIPAASALLQAQGAVLGQIVGEAALQEGSTLDNLAEGFLGALVDGTAVFNAPIQDSQPQQNNDPGTLPQTLVLTSGVDVLGPTPDFPLEADDTVIGNGQTIQSGDSVDLGAGNDKANLFIEPTSLLQLLSVYKLTLTNIEQVNVTPTNSINAAIPLQISADNWTGVQEFWLRDSNLGGTAGVIVDDIQSNMALGFDDYQGTATYLYDAGALPAGNNQLSVVLQDGSTVALNTNTQLAADNFGRMNLTSIGAGNTLALNLQSAGGLDGLTELHLFGDGFVTMNEAEFNTLTVLNGSAGGGFNITIPASSAGLAATGSAFNDTLNFAGGAGRFTTADSFDGNGGADLLRMHVLDAAAATAANVSEVETLNLYGVINSNLQVENNAGFTTVVFEDSTSNGNALEIDGFANVVLNGDNYTGLVNIDNNATPTTVTIGDLADFGDGGFGDLDVSETQNVTINVAPQSGGFAYLDELTIDGLFSQTTSLKFTSGETGPLTIDNIDGTIGLVDASGFGSTLIFNDDFGSGADFLLGSLNGGSEIELSGAAVSELVFTGGLSGNTSVFGFDVTAGTGDVIDLAGLGISSLADISVQFVEDGGGDDVVITSNANPGAWSITIEEVGNNNAAAIVALVQARIDYDGVIG